ncbi:MAG: dihydroxyacetone kinase subunit DhaL [Mesorhizobium sp.]|jgi:phosphoenolpyruvate---glycerone phosphotransferase subunit DhaL
MTGNRTAADIPIRELIATVANTFTAHAEELTALDQAIGDGDHGLNMRRGFEAVRAETDSIAEKSLPEALKAIGMKLVMTVGGASGPLYGTLFMTLGKELPDTPDRGEFATAFGKAVESVAARGKSGPGQKTMLDVLYPINDALVSGTPPAELPDMADAAAEATVPMKASRGRASFLGDRSIGHMDPGARSSALMIRAVVERLGRLA